MLRFVGILVIFMEVMEVNAVEDSQCKEDDLRTMLVNIRQLKAEYEELTENVKTETANLARQCKQAEQTNNAQDRQLELLLERLNETEAEMASRQSAIDSLTQQVTAINMEKESQEASFEAMNVTLQNTAREIESIKTVLNLTQKDIPGVAFIVRQTEVHTGCSSPLEFGTVVKNEGNAFNSSTNYFTAPFTGYYLFSVQLCSHDKSSFDFAVKSRTYNSVYAASRNGLTDDHTCTSVSAAVQLTSREEVYVYVDCPGTGTIEGHNGDKFWTMFSGVLLHY